MDQKLSEIPYDLTYLEPGAKGVHTNYKEYYTIVIDFDMPYFKSARSLTTPIEMAQWCQETFGQYGKDSWVNATMATSTVFYFRESKDAMLFKLSWAR